MEQYDGTRHGLVGASPPGTGREVHDRHWAGDLRAAVRCAAALLGLLLLIDWSAGDLTWWRGVLWGTLAVLLFLILFPARVSAGEGWLASRRLVCTRRVRTDRLVSVRSVDGVSRRLVLRDTFGNRLELDPRVLVDNPDLWCRLSEDTHRSTASGALRSGTTALREVSERIDRETALNVFRTSGLE